MSDDYILTNSQVAALTRRLVDTVLEFKLDAQIAHTEHLRLQAETNRLRAALESICMMDISWVGDAFKMKDIARAALTRKETHEQD